MAEVDEQHRRHRVVDVAGNTHDGDAGTAGLHTHDVAEGEPGVGVLLAGHRFVGALGQPSADERGGLAGVAQLVPEDHGVGLVAIGGDGERGLAERGRNRHTFHLGDGCLLIGEDDRAVQVLARLSVVDQHLARLVLEGADELVDQPGEQRLLEQDEEHEQPDRAGQQAEPHLCSSHLFQGQEHRSAVNLAQTVKPPRPATSNPAAIPVPALAVRRLGWRPGGRSGRQGGWRGTRAPSAPIRRGLHRG